MDPLDELEGFQADVAKALEASGADVISINGQLQAEGTVTASKGVEELNLDRDAIEFIALESKKKKLRKKIATDVVEEIDAMDEEALKKRIVRCQCNLEENDRAKEADDELRDLKVQVKEFSAPYAEVKKVQNAIAAYATIALKEKGKA